MLVVMTVRTVVKVPFEKAAPYCPSDVPAPLVIGCIPLEEQINVRPMAMITLDNQIH